MTATATGNQRKARVYHDNVRGSRDITQNLLALQMMREVGLPQTIRMLHKIINSRGFKIELTDLRRSITNLEKPDKSGRWLNQFGRKMVKVSLEKECPITKVKVGWYEIIEQQLPLFQ